MTHVPTRCLYARVDVVESSRGPLLMELELIEPELYFLIVPEAADRMAQLIVDRLCRNIAPCALPRCSFRIALSSQRRQASARWHCSATGSRPSINMPPVKRDAALATVAAWTYNDLEMMRDLRRSARGRAAARQSRPRGRRALIDQRHDLAAIRKRINDLQARGDFDEFRKRAAILHTDAALLAAPPVVVAPPATQRRDGRRHVG